MGRYDAKMGRYDYFGHADFMDPILLGPPHHVPKIRF